MNTREDILKTRFGNELREASVPLLEASTHPPEFYTSKEFFQLEVERIFLKEWLCVGRWDEIEKAGDFLTINVLGQPLIITRNEANRIQAFSAVCLHRGMEVVEGRGNQKSFQCRYHGWTYSLEGKPVAELPRWTRPNTSNVTHSDCLA